MSANDIESGSFAINTGSTLQIHIDDALVLGSDHDTLTFPTSIVASSGTQVTAVPAVSALWLALKCVNTNPK